MNTKDRQVLADNFPDFLHLGGTTEQQAELKTLLLRYVDVFALGDEDPGFSDKVQHEIHLVDDATIA